MKLSIKKTGAWDKVPKILNGLRKNLVPAFVAQIQSDGELYLQTIIDHIDRQDLNWVPLSERTIELKGGDDTVYVETGFLIDNLKVLKVTSTKKKVEFFIGAPNTVRTSEGVKLSDLMIWLEYGTDKIPARPLLRPSWSEIEPIIKNNMRELLTTLIKTGGEGLDLK